MTTISAQTILRSRNTAAPDYVLSTLLLRYPRWIHAEFMTHRVFSRNAASSRAIPVEKLVADVMTDPAVPLFWGKNQKGMQAAEEVDAAVFAAGSYRNRADAWLHARDLAVNTACDFAEAGYHKQIVNRLLEPFAHITVLVSSTQWANFLALRDHADAEPHIAMLARAIRAELDRTDNIQTLQPGEWHLPFAADMARLLPPAEVDKAIKLSVARCASTSYKTVDGFEMTLDRAIALHDKLVGSTPLHASPAEHVAQADDVVMAGGRFVSWMHHREHANYEGFRQYRKMLPNEAVHG